MIKIIDNFEVEVKVFNKRYYCQGHVINLPYALFEGDFIMSLYYEGRGFDFKNAQILEVDEDYIVISEQSFYNHKICKLYYNREPNYTELLGPQYFKGGEERRLIFRPFPLFLEKPDFKKLITDNVGSEIFHRNCKMYNPKDIRKYVDNIFNVVVKTSRFKKGVLESDMIRYLFEISCGIDYSGEMVK